MGLPETAVSRVSCAGWQPCLILDADEGQVKFPNKTIEACNQGTARAFTKN